MDRYSPFTSTSQQQHVNYDAGKQSIIPRVFITFTQGRTDVSRCSDGRAALLRQMTD